MEIGAGRLHVYGGRIVAGIASEREDRSEIKEEN
jgi:hypothetical protein